MKLKKNNKCGPIAIYSDTLLTYRQCIRARQRLHCIELWFGFKDLDSCAKKEVTINLARVQKRFVAVGLNYQSPLFCVGAEGLFHD